MQIEVEESLNSTGCELTIFQELESPKPIRGLRAEHEGQDADCDVVGIGPEGSVVQAYMQKIADSGEGDAYLIHGGTLGIRLRPPACAHESDSGAKSIRQ